MHITMSMLTAMRPLRRKSRIIKSENETSKSAENDQRTPIEITLLENDNGPVNKTITLGPNGELQKTGVANIWSGKLFRVPLIDWRYMALGLEGLRSNHAIALGRLRADLGSEAYLIPFPHQDDLRMYGNEVMDFTVSGLRSM